MIQKCRYSFLGLLCLLGIVNALGQTVLPSFVDYTSADSDTLTWKDKQGLHFLLMETSDIVKGEEPQTHSQSIHITHALQQKEKITETWSYEDGEYDCPVDVRTIFRAAPRFSDLNNNGIYEMWFIIEKFCKGDISPSQIQIIMVDEKGQKYKLDGEAKQTFPDGNIYGGEYDLKDFKTLPEKYVDYAIDYFNRNNAELFIEI